MFGFALLVGISLSTPSSALEFPALTNSNTQIISLPDGNIDMALRMKSIRNAKKSVEFISYLQSIDPLVGGPLLKEFRAALDRGLSGRFLYDNLLSRPFDPLGKAAKVLKGKTNAELLCMGPISKIKCGLTPTDYFHDKILIIDRGTPDEMIFLGGRNNERFAKEWLDYAVVIRPADPGKPYLGTQIKEAFDKNWKLANRIQPQAEYKETSHTLLETLHATTSNPQDLLDRRALAAFLDISAVLDSPPGQKESKYAFMPKSARVLTNDFMEQALRKETGRTIPRRATTIESDIVTGAAKALRSADRIDIAAMTIQFPREILQEIKNALARGAHVRIFTDGKEAHGKMNLGFGYKFSLPQLDEIVEAAKAHPGQLEILAFQPGSKPEDGSTHGLDYMHRKMLVAYQPDGEAHAFVGSDIALHKMLTGGTPTFFLMNEDCDEN